MQFILTFDNSIILIKNQYSKGVHEIAGIEQGQATAAASIVQT
jgi:hypothetical protein